MHDMRHWWGLVSLSCMMTLTWYSGSRLLLPSLARSCLGSRVIYYLMLFHTHVNVSFFFFFLLIFYGINRGGSQEKTSYNTSACSPLHSRAVHAGLALAPLVKHSDSAECLMENKHRKLSLSALTLESRSQPSHHLALGSWLRFFTAQGLHNPASSSPVPLADGGPDHDHSDAGPPCPLPSSGPL